MWTSLAALYIQCVFVSLLLVSAMLFPGRGGSSADTTRGASLLRGCRAELRLMDLSSLDEAPPMDLINGAYCIGYVNGFTAASLPAVALICAAGSDMGHLVRAYVRYMDLHPELLEEDKKLGLRLALQDAFPCPTPH